MNARTARLIGSLSLLALVLALSPATAGAPDPARWPIGGGVRSPGLHAHCTSGSAVMCSTSAWTERPLFFPGSFSARQRSASDRSSHAMLRGARCQCGAPGTRPSAVFVV